MARSVCICKPLAPRRSGRALDCTVAVNAKVLRFLFPALLVGCSKSDPNLPGYAVASGDAAAFVLQAAIGYGARPLKTIGLPKLEGEWRYKAEEDGIQIELIGGRFGELQALLQGAFGLPAIAPKTNFDGRITMGVYAAPSTGATIQYGHEETLGGVRYTEILIVRAGALQ